MNIIYSNRSNRLNSVLRLFEYLPFLFEEDILVISFFDITSNVYLVFFDLIILVLILILFSFYFTNIIWIKYSNNSDYLWRLFREQQQLTADSCNWVKESATSEILNYYTKQLDYIEYSPEIEKLKSTNALKNLENHISEISKERDFFSYKNFRSNFKKGGKFVNKKKFINQISLYLKFIEDFRKQTRDTSLTSSFLKDLVMFKIFDYNRYIVDPTYSSYYKIVLNDSLKLSIFVVRGVKRDYFIHQIYLQEDETYPEMLSLDQEEANILLETKWNEFLIWLYMYDNILGHKLPNWMIHKDIGGIFLHSKLVSDRKEVYIFDQSSILFDVFFIIVILIPIYLIQFFYSFYFTLHLGIRLPAIQDLFTLFKLLVINIWPVYLQEFLKNIGITTWSWFSKNVHTVGNGYPGLFRYSYGNHFYIDLYSFDPFFGYDTILKEYHNQVFYYNEKGYYNKSFNSNIFIFIWNCFYLIKDWVILMNSSFKFNFCSIISVYIWLIIIIIGCIRVKYFNKPIITTNVEIKFFIYLDKVYNINKIKWNNYLKKIWF